MSTWTDAEIDLLDTIYQLQCASRMNAIYYELRLARLQLISFWLEIGIAMTASGSGIGTLVTKAPGTIGVTIWSGIAIAAAIAAVVRPIYAPGKRIETFTRQHQGYHANFFALRKLAFSIRQEAKVTPEHRRRFDTFYDRHVQLSTDTKAADDESSPRDKYRREAELRTRAELPAEKFWWPKDAVAHAKPAEPAEQAAIASLVRKS